jgi:hypothetical protein
VRLEHGLEHAVAAQRCEQVDERQQQRRRLEERAKPGADLFKFKCLLLIDCNWKNAHCAQEPILRLLNLQLRRQRCCRLERFLKGKNSFILKTQLVQLQIFTTLAL